MSGAAPDRTARRRSLRPTIAGAVLAVLLAGLLPEAGLAGQEGAPPPRDTLRLGELHRAVRSLDPRSRQLPLRRRATRARVDAVRSDWTPGLRLTARIVREAMTERRIRAFVLYYFVLFAAVTYLVFVFLQPVFQTVAVDADMNLQIFDDGELRASDSRRAV